jgi:diadenylate cyclase
VKALKFLSELWTNTIGFLKYNVIDVLKTIELNDIIDIIVLAALFFFMYRFAKKRRAIKLVTGVVLFLLVMFIGDAINLTALGFVFGDFRQLGVIAILIIFQPEFRSALEKIGGTTFLGIQNMQTINHNDKKKVGAQYTIESVSRAAQRLSTTGHGALIIIERDNNLSDYKRTGTKLDAVISPDLLCSIFYKGGALHDGAVIVHNGKVDTAACIIRVTDRVDIDSSLGTRHRAAIGTSEVCDAIVVVVSEETGNISLSIDGNLERNFNYSSLRARLEEILIPKPKNDTKKPGGKRGSRIRKTQKKENKENID